MSDQNAIPVALRSAPSGASRIDKVSCLPMAYRAVLEGHAFAPPPLTLLSPPEMADLRDQLLAGRRARTEELLHKYKPARSTADNVLAIIKEASLSRKDTAFDNADVGAALTARVAAMLRPGAAVTLAMMTGGLKIQNMLKAPRGIDPDLAEWVAVNTLQALADAIKAVTGAPARIVLVGDGPLHTGDLGLDARLADLNLAVLRDDARHVLQAPDVIPASPREQLDDRWYLYLLDEVRNVRRAAEHDADLRQKLAGQAEALVSALNLRPRGWSYAHTVLVFAAVAGYPADGPAARDAEELKRLALRVSYGYTAVNRAIRELRLVERVVRQVTGQDLFLRASVHAKPYEPRLALAPSNHLSRHYLLPMHSTGRVETAADGRPRYGPLFDLEGRVGGMALVGFFDERLKRARPLFYRAAAPAAEGRARAG